MTLYAYSIASETHTFRLELSEFELILNGLRLAPARKGLHLPHRMHEAERVLRAALVRNAREVHTRLEGLGERLHYRYGIAAKGRDGRFHALPLGKGRSCRFQGQDADVVAGLGHCFVERSEPVVVTPEEHRAAVREYGLEPTWDGPLYGSKRHLMHDLTDMEPVTVDLVQRLATGEGTLIKASRRRAAHDLLDRLGALIDFLEGSDEAWCECWPTTG